MAKEENLEQVEQYLSGAMNEADQAAFEARLKDEAELQEDVAFMKLLNKSGFNAGFKEEMDAFHEELFPEKEARLSTVRRWIPYAAAVLIFLSLAVYFLLSPQPAIEQLASDYFQPFPNYVSMRSIDMDENFSLGLKKYSLNQFDSAYYFLSQARVGDAYATDLAFYAGISSLALQKNDVAIASFSNLLQERSKYDQQIRWYLALAYLGQGNVESCIQYLDQIEAEDFNYQLAQKLKKELDSDR